MYENTLCQTTIFLRSKTATPLRNISEKKGANVNITAINYIVTFDFIIIHIKLYYNVRYLCLIFFSFNLEIFYTQFREILVFFLLYIIFKVFSVLQNPCRISKKYL